MNYNISYSEKFSSRHHGKNESDTKEMLDTIGVSSVEELINQTVPANIRLKSELDLPAPLSESEFLEEFKSIASKNLVYKTFIGTGYYNTFTPRVILRNILENPAWYTAYTPYQAEIAQGRLEALLNYQTMVIDLTGMEIANASLLDESTAAAEAMTMLYASRPAAKKNANKFVVSSLVHPQTIDLLVTRATPLDIQLVIEQEDSINLNDNQLFGVLLQYPATDGSVNNYASFVQTSKEQNVFVAFATDLLSLTLLTPPGEFGADVVIGSSQRMGVPMGFGGPHAAFFATKESFKRLIPGRIIGVSVDANGKKAYRMALQTREQHIRREKATSNICTAQVLLSVIAGNYAVYHGPTGLLNIATKVHSLTALLAFNLQKLGVEILNASFFDTISIKINDTVKLKQVSENKQINFRYSAAWVGISIDETTTLEDIKLIVNVFAEVLNKEAQFSEEYIAGIPSDLERKTPFLQHEVFNSHHTEHEMLRYLKYLENKDLSLVHSMISLGSCTMKLNATSEMIPVTWPEIGNMHPFAPRNQTLGYQEIFKNLEKWLCEITGFDAVSLQPNSGAQGEYAGLLAIRAYHLDNGDVNRNIAIIPSSAHGTNPASAVMAGMKVLVSKCDENGNIDIADIKRLAEENSENLSCLMVTYPSTHGVFEESIIEICDIIHANGGQVYMDGANMNAQVGLTSPANIGADVCHLNLHKTFCIPHGGGGPGVGPIGVKSHLAPFLPGHVLVDIGHANPTTAISGAPWGSASILPISYAYIRMMGAEGLKEATQNAILNANYLKARFENDFKILYSGANGRCAHEMIVDCREFKNSAGIEVVDLAKRLMDYGFHAPTVSFPVAGTLMIEPTESESKAELDRFAEALLSIRQEIRDIETGLIDKQDNVLKNAPHTADILLQNEWTKAYSREKAAYPLPYVKNTKFWPSVSRIDDAFGDRNLVCSCEPIESYQE